jgi:hypothetical protein
VRRGDVRPLLIVAAGLLLAVLEFRVRSVDLLADPAGWLLVGLGAWELRLTRPALAASVAAVSSAVDFVRPYHLVEVNPLTGEPVTPAQPGRFAQPNHLLWDRLSAGRAAVAAATLVAGGFAVVGVLRELARRADKAADPQWARRLRVLRVVVPAAWVLPYVGVVAADLARDGSFDPVWNRGRALLVVPGFVAVVTLAWVLVRCRDEAWALRPSRWEDVGR